MNATAIERDRRKLLPDDTLDRSARLMHAGVVVCVVVAGAACCERGTGVPERGQPGPAPSGAATVWITDDGDRIASRAGVLPAMSGTGNAVWSPGQPARLFALPGETVVLQVVVTAGSDALSDVRVEIRSFHRAGGADPTDGIHTEAFLVSELRMDRRSGGKDESESLGWQSGSMPADPSVGGIVPDPLIPIRYAQPWANYPMTVAAGHHRVVWLDLAVRDDPGLAGDYQAEIAVEGHGVSNRIPVELEVGRHPLPYAAVRTMAYFDPTEVQGRTNDARAIESAFRVLHAHHVSPVFPIRSREDVDRYKDALTGAAYDALHGYAGPGVSRAADVVVIGAYGDLGEPTEEKVARLREIVQALEALGIRDDPGKTDVFVYAADEDCSAPAGAGWTAAIRKAGIRVRVGWTCSEKPASQPVDIVMMFASAYDPALAQQARAAGKHVWIYNGQLPHTGAFLTDAWTLSLRANAWVQALEGIERWFYWETTFWNDDNRGGKGPYDPLETAETFHNQHGDHCNGDGVLLYPGQQPGGRYRSAGAAEVFPSMRLAQWRRGIQDAGYLQLARAVDRDRADAVAKGLLGDVLSRAKPGKPGWPTGGADWVQPRRALFDIIESR